MSQEPATQNTLISWLSNRADSGHSAALGQMQSDSDKTYGPDDTDFVRWKRYGFPGAELSKGEFLICVKNNVQQLV